MRGLLSPWLKEQRSKERRSKEQRSKEQRGLAPGHRNLELRGKQALFGSTNRVPIDAEPEAEAAEPATELEEEATVRG